MVKATPREHQQVTTQPTARKVYVENLFFMIGIRNFVSVVYMKNLFSVIDIENLLLMKKEKSS